MEVPYGAMVELPPSVTYLKEMLLANTPWAWNVVKSEWAVLCGAYLVDEYRLDGKLWLFPRALRQWITRVGPKTVCSGPAGVDEVAVRVLEALLALLDELPFTAAFRERLRVVDTGRRDRSSWVRVRVVHKGLSATARVDEDLAPFPLAYSDDVLEGRDLEGLETRAAEVSMTTNPGPSAHGGGGPSSTCPQSPSRPVRASGGPAAHRFLLASTLAHRDVPDEALAPMDAAVPPEGTQRLAIFLGGGPPTSEGSLRVGPLVAGLFHVLAEVGSDVTKWATRQEGLPVAEVQALVDVVGQASLRASVWREVGLAEDAARRAYARRLDTVTPRVRPREEDPEGGEGRGGRVRGRY